MNLIVPVDFTSASNTAVKYAAEFLKHVEGSLHLVHVITPTGIDGVPVTNSDKISKNIIQELHFLMRNLEKAQRINVSCEVRIGKVADEICEASNEKKSDYLIMSSKGSDSKFTVSANGYRLIEQSSTPVLTVSGLGHFNAPQRIVFATDYHPGDIEDLKIVTRFAALFGAEVLALHIVNRFEDEDEVYDIEMVRTFSTLVNRKIHYDHVECQEFQFTNVADGIRCYLADEKADVLAISSSHKHFIDQILSTHASHEFMYNPAIPLFTFSK